MCSDHSFGNTGNIGWRETTLSSGIHPPARTFEEITIVARYLAAMPKAVTLRAWKTSPPKARPPAAKARETSSLKVKRAESAEADPPLRPLMNDAEFAALVSAQPEMSSD